MTTTKTDEQTVPFDEQTLVTRALELYGSIDTEQMYRTVKAMRSLNMTATTDTTAQRLVDGWLPIDDTDHAKIGCLIHDALQENRRKHLNVIAVYDAIKPYLARKFTSLADAPKELFDMAEKDSFIADKIATSYASHNCFHGCLEEAYILANLAVDIAKQCVYATPPTTSEEA